MLVQAELDNKKKETVLVAQMDSLGVGSLSIVILTGMFTGMVLTLQSAASLDAFGARPYVGRLVCVSMVGSNASSPGVSRLSVSATFASCSSGPLRAVSVSITPPSASSRSATPSSASTRSINPSSASN